METMENTICLDSDFIINLLRNKKEAVQWIESHKENKFCTTAINLFEVFYGAYRLNKKSEISSIRSFFHELPVLDFTAENAQTAAQFAERLEKEGNMLEIRDIFIASIALNHQLPIKTYNIKHFQRIPTLQLAD